MPLSSPTLRRFVRHALLAAPGVATPNQAQLALAFDLLSDRLGARLDPIFGSTALGTLFGRALRVASAEFPWLVDVVATPGKRSSLEALESVTPSLEPQHVLEGFAAVLAHEIGLLSTFVGDDVVMPLLQDAWGTASLGDGPAKAEGNR